MANNEIALCLPKGDALEPLAQWLASIQFPVKDYNAKNRSYRPDVEISDAQVRAKIMAEKDVVVQVSVGNYDIGFCGLDWIREHTVRYRSAKVVVYRSLNMNPKQIHACTGINGPTSIDQLRNGKHLVTIVSEYPNLAEHFAIRHRLPRFRIFSAWGSVEAYPPEHADVVLLGVRDEQQIPQMGLYSIGTELQSELMMILNRKSLMEKDLSPVLTYFQKDDMEAEDGSHT